MENFGDVLIVGSDYYPINGRSEKFQYASLRDGSLLEISGTNLMNMVSTILTLPTIPMPMCLYGERATMPFLIRAVLPIGSIEITGIAGHFVLRNREYLSFQQLWEHHHVRYGQRRKS
ncbi:MAG: hypothetical protein IPF52_16310 [Saprospiraceae bacterium]|nr:hypothetical protein [Saprospiraceae bacterium]